MGLTRKGLKAMEELAKLEAQRGNPEYLETEYGEGGVRGGRSLKGSGAGESFRRQEGAGRGGPGKGRDRRASNEMCIFLILNISSLQLIPEIGRASCRERV